MELPNVTVSMGLNTIWVVLTASMIFFMEGGFALLEAGFIRSKNHVSIIMKVFVDLIFGVFAFYMVGFGLMFGTDARGIVGFSGFGIARHLEHLPTTIPHSAFWLFQAAFAVAAISIVSGAVAERMNFKAYMLYVLAMTAVIYPVSGHWVWGSKGWLARFGMEDFAGSAVIHAMAGFAALTAAHMIGARIGKFPSGGRVDGGSNQPSSFAPSNLPLAAVGTFVLWFGWFGFNAGSTLNAQAGNIGQIAMNTLLASIAGGGSAMLFTLFKGKQADIALTINGILAGLVAITAGCAYVESGAALMMGAVSGVLMTVSTQKLETLRIDDPVGAVPVHGVSGIFGTVMVGLFATKGGLFTTGHWHLFLVQLLGAAVLSLWGAGATFVSLKAIAWFVPLRVTREQEELGLDLSQHGASATHPENDGRPFPKPVPHPRRRDAGPAALPYFAGQNVED